jgi:hypothetical protein
MAFEIRINDSSFEFRTEIDDVIGDAQRLCDLLRAHGVLCRAAFAGQDLRKSWSKWICPEKESHGDQFMSCTLEKMCNDGAIYTAGEGNEDFHSGKY